VAAVGRGRVNRLENLVGPVLPAHFVGHRNEAQGRVHDMGVGVNDAAGQPVFEVINPESPVRVGVVPDEIERL